ncbi:MAG TPA: hypothetical protein VI278_14540 [Nitrososphaeraceae archaeon]
MSFFYIKFDIIIIQTHVNYLCKDIVKDGSIIPMSEALSAGGLTDEKGNTITITFTDPLPE